MQEVWLTLVRKLVPFGPEASGARFEAWLVTLAQRKAIDLLREKRRRHHSHHDLDSHPGTDSDPVGACERQELVHAVRQAIDRLAQQISSVTSQALKLRWLEGRTVSEIAGALSLNSTKVWNRLHEGKRELRRLLADAVEKHA